MSATQIEMAVITPGQHIQDGTHFISPNGVHCYKLPKKTFDQVLAFGSNAGLASIASYDDDKLARALAWTRDRLDDKGTDADRIYLILPVSKEKQRESLGMYMRNLWAFRKEIQAEQLRRASDTAFA